MRSRSFGTDSEEVKHRKVRRLRRVQVSERL